MPYDFARKRLSVLVELDQMGVRLKIISGDNALVAAHVGEQVGLVQPRLLTGADLQRLSDAALPARARNTEIFAEIEPSQKERNVRALRRSGHTARVCPAATSVSGDPGADRAGLRRQCQTGQTLLLPHAQAEDGTSGGKRPQGTAMSARHGQPVCHRQSRYRSRDCPS